MPNLNAAAARDQANPARALRRRYQVALVAIGLLSLLTFSVLELLLARGDGLASAINVAGRQRSLSQEIVYAIERNDRSRLMDVLDQLESAHHALQHGDASRGLPPTTNEATLRAFGDLEESFRGLVTAGRDRLALPASEPTSPALIERALRYEQTFLPQMHAIVGMYEADAQAVYRTAMLTQLLVAMIMLLTLVAIAAWIFEPAARRLHRQWDSLRASQERFDLAITGSQEAIWDWSLPDDRMYLSPRWAELFGDQHLPQATEVEAWFRHVASNDLPRLTEALDRLRTGQSKQIDLEIEMRSSQNERVVALCRGASARDEHGRVTRLVGSLADITAQREVLERMRDMAERDGLTGLNNRGSFHDRLELTVMRSLRDSCFNYAVLSFDFDGFKAVNDALGHSAGDALLVSIAERFQEHLPKDAVIARLGGDEFAVLLHTSEESGYGSMEALLRLCESLNTAFALPHDIGGHPIVSTASIGIVVGNASYNAAEAVLRDADAAMYAAKEAGRGQVRLFDASMHQQAIRRLRIETRLRALCFDDDFELLLQPIVDLETGKPDGFEVLLRTTGPELAGIGPDVLIPVAEETGLIIELGTWILDRAAKLLDRLDRHVGHQETVLHVNVSKRQMLHPSFAKLLRSLLSTHPQHKGRLVLEITETSVMDPRNNLRPAMSLARDLGFPLSMDDFGTGHSSLACLHQFPLDEVKIDRSFILNIEGSREFTAIYQAIVSLADHLGLKVIAEGVETEGQLAQLQAMGCAFGQGYLFDRPLSVEDAMDCLEQSFGRPTHRRTQGRNTGPAAA